MTVSAATEQPRAARLAEPAVVDERLRHRLRLLATSCVLGALCFAQEPGKILNDTKLDMALDPVGFLRRAAHLWNPDWHLGMLQNQASGYFFPMGPFFAGGQALGLPPWVVQRLWIWALLLTAFLGVARLARLLGLGTPATRLVAALAYALAPRAIALGATVSAELLPYCLAPWVLVPLVHASRGRSARRAAAQSGLAVLAMGGINAAAVALVLPLAVLWLATRPAGRERRRLVAWWCLAMVLACAWWAVPLGLLAAYGFAFLPFTETAAVTTAHSGLAEVARGGEHWVAHLGVQGFAWWPAGFASVTRPVPLIATGAVAALGVYGIARRDTPHRRFLVLAVLAGAAVLTAGHASGLAPPWDEAVREALDGSLAPLRNLHKADAVLRLPLALGMAAALAHVPAVLRRSGRRAPAFGVVAGAVTVALAASPAINPGLAAGGAFPALPTYWREAGSWLSANAKGATLVTPGAAFGEYVWGRPLDEPLQTIRGVRWAARGLVPQGSPGSARLVAAIDGRLATGEGSAGLAVALRRAGISHVLVRNDLDRLRAERVWPLRVHQALSTSPGLERVATFGPGTGSGPSAEETPAWGLDRTYPALEVWRVAGEVGPVDTYPAETAVAVEGAPEAVVPLADTQSLGERAVFVGSDASARTPRLLTDTLRRRSVDFGRVFDNASPTLARDDDARGTRRVLDVDDPAWAGAHAVAAYRGDRGRASSSASDADAAPGLRGSIYAPWNALDSDERTAWVSGGRSDPTREELRVILGPPRQLRDVRLILWRSPDLDARPRTVVVDTGHGRASAHVHAGAGAVDVPLPAGPAVAQLRISFPDVERRQLGIRVGIREVLLPGGTTARRSVAVPAHPATAAGVLVTRATGYATPCAGDAATWSCAPLLARLDEDGETLVRDLDLAGDLRAPLRGTAVIRPGLWLRGMLSNPEVAVRASSERYNHPAAWAEAAFDGDRGTSWVPAPEDRTPSLTLQWPRAHRLRSIALALPRDAAASAPTSVQLTSPAGIRSVPLGLSGTARFPTLVTNQVTISFPSTYARLTRDPYTLSTEPLPVAVAEVRLGGAPAPRPPQDFATFAATCGSGPDVQVAGRTYRTSLTGTRGDLRAVRPLWVQGCGSRPLVPAGQSRVVARPVRDAVAVTLAIAPRMPAGADKRETELLAWGSSARSMRLGAGAESWLVVNENFNAGWRATLDGRPLRSARVDGWRQAWLVPAGTGGTIRLDYAPDRTYRVSLLVGLVLAVALVLLAGWPSRRTGPAGPRPATPHPARQGKVAGSRSRLAATAAALLAPVFGLVIAGVPGVVAGLGVVAVRWWAGPHSRLRRLTGPGPTAWLVLVAAVLAATYRAASGTGLAVPVTWWDEIPSVLVLVAFLRLAADVTGADVVRRHRTRAGTHHRRADPACTDHAPRSDVRAGDAITPDRSRQ